MPPVPKVSARFSTLYLSHVQGDFKFSIYDPDDFDGWLAFVAILNFIAHVGENVKPVTKGFFVWFMRLVIFTVRRYKLIESPPNLSWSDIVSTSDGMNFTFTGWGNLSPRYVDSCREGFVVENRKTKRSRRGELSENRKTKRSRRGELV